ncbi:MAG: DNA polymerase III subunit delta' [bacterium]
MKFNWDFVGNGNIVEYLKKSLLNRQLVHGYLFYGPDHVGKEKLANFFINSILCADQASGSVPCQTCLHCQQLAKGIHPDVFWLNRQEGKKNISIEQVNELRNKLGMSSFLNSYKIAVIQEADKMSRGAANALLKTLEEPAKKTIVILITSKISFLPETIVSRCQILRFKPVATLAISEYLTGQGIERYLASVIANLSAGRPGLAINLSEDSDLLNYYQERAKVFLKLKAGDISQRFKEVKSLVDGSDSYSEKNDGLLDVLDIWLSVLRDIFLIKSLSVDLIKNIFIQEELEKLASRYSYGRLREIIKNLKQTQDYLRQNVNQQLALENLVINF